MIIRLLITLIVSVLLTAGSLGASSASSSDYDTWNKADGNLLANEGSSTEEGNPDQRRRDGMRRMT